MPMHELDYVLWRGYLEAIGDSTTLARLDALYAAEKTDCPVSWELQDGTVTYAPMVILAEAVAASQEGQGEEEWRADWTRRLLFLVEAWEDELTLRGVGNALVCMDQAVANMKRAAVWPWDEEVN